MTFDKDRDYLGDSVYVETHGHMIRLTTENGQGASNEIFLEPETLQSLLKWCVRNGWIKSTDK